MNALIRLDANSLTGSGHFFRSLEIAKILIKKKIKVFFITRYIDDFYIKLLRKEKILHILIPLGESRLKNQYDKFFEKEEISTVNRLVKNFFFKIIIIDHYSIASEWEKKIKNKSDKIMVLDDLNKNKHICDFYVNPNLIITKDSIKNKMINNKTHIFLGIKYLFVNEKFSKLKKIKKNKFSIFIYFGNVDSNNVLKKLLKIISGKEFNIYKKIVIFPTNKFNKSDILKIQKNISNFYVYKFTDKFETHISSSMFGIGAAGHNLYERISAGMINFVVAQSTAQLKIANKLKSSKIIYGTSYHKESNIILKKKLLNFINSDTFKDKSKFINLLDINFNQNTLNHLVKKIINL